MAGKRDAARAKKLQTISIAQRKLVGQAIIDGLLTPGSLVITQANDYDQGTGNYDQGGGDHDQGGGNYNQHAEFNVQELVSRAILDKAIR